MEPGTRALCLRKIPLNESKVNGKGRDVGERDMSRDVLKQNSKNGPGRVWDFVGCVDLSMRVHGSQWDMGDVCSCDHSAKAEVRRQPGGVVSLLPPHVSQGQTQVISLAATA